jgi:hypothetical protein
VESPSAIARMRLNFTVLLRTKRQYSHMDVLNIKDLLWAKISDQVIEHCDTLHQSLIDMLVTLLSDKQEH